MSLQDLNIICVSTLSLLLNGKRFLDGPLVLQVSHSIYGAIGSTVYIISGIIF